MKEIITLRDAVELMGIREIIREPSITMNRREKEE
jgi:hypothetical protein